MIQVTSQGYGRQVEDSGQGLEDNKGLIAGKKRNWREFELVALIRSLHTYQEPGWLGLVWHVSAAC